MSIPAEQAYGEKGDKARQLCSVPMSSACVMCTWPWWAGDGRMSRQSQPMCCMHVTQDLALLGGREGGQWGRTVFLLCKMEVPRKSLLQVVERSPPNHSYEGTLAVPAVVKNKENANQGHTLKMFECQLNRNSWSGWYCTVVCSVGDSAHGWGCPGQLPLCHEGLQTPCFQRVSMKIM